MPDTLSVVITNFQRPQFLWEAFASCVRAGVPHIVVSSSGVNSEVKAVHDKIRYKRPETIIVSETGDSGCNSNWLAGVKAAHTKWVTLLHDDDLLLEDYGKLRNHIERNPDAGFWLWDAKRHGMGYHDLYPTLDLPTGVYHSEMLFRNLLIPDHFTLSPTIGCFQREDLVATLEECRDNFDSTFHIRPTMMVGNDLMIWLRAIQKYARLGYVKAPFTSYGHHAGSATCDEVFQKRGKFPTIYNKVRDYFTRSCTRILHVTPYFKTSDNQTLRRHAVAEASWERLYRTGLYRKLHGVRGSRDSRDIGDKRATPYLKDVLQAGLNSCPEDGIVMLTNNDTVLHYDLTWHLLSMMREEWAVCAFRQGYTRCPDLVSARQDHDSGQHDTGRDLFAFTPQWLREHWEIIPDYVLGASDWDSTLATLIRMSKGIAVNAVNWVQRDERCELKTGFVFHERHSSFWSEGQNRTMLAGNIYNRALSMKFIKEHGVGWVL